MNDFLKNLLTVFPINHRRTVYRQVLLQRSLSKTGEPAAARVMEIRKGRGIYNYINLKLAISIQSESGVVYRQLNTLAGKTNIPKIGEIIPIRYCPDDLSGMMVIAE
ncbi:MAG TPA: hypothetical protein VF144_05710 [Chitinophagaceae bacterium]